MKEKYLSSSETSQQLLTQSWRETRARTRAQQELGRLWSLARVVQTYVTDCCQKQTMGGKIRRQGYPKSPPRSQLLISLISAKLPVDRGSSSSSSSSCLWFGEKTLVGCCSRLLLRRDRWGSAFKLSAAQVIPKLQLVLVSCETPELFAGGRGPYINTSNLCLAFTENSGLIFNTLIRSCVNSSAKRMQSLNLKKPKKT